MSSALALPAVDADEVQPYAVVGVANARPDRADDLEAVLVAMVAPTRREPGALDYHVHRDRADPNRFVFYETWASREDLERHLEQPYVTAFLESRMTYLIEDMQVSWLKMASPFG